MRRVRLDDRGYGNERDRSRSPRPDNRGNGDSRMRSASPNGRERMDSRGLVLPSLLIHFDLLIVL